jgi:hypothetical protein
VTVVEHVEGYALGRVLGRGGSGTVYEAHQQSTGRAVAVKMLEVDDADGEVARRFDRERAAMSVLADHPAIVSILDAGVQDGRPWLAMDLCPAGSLAGLERPLPVPEVLAVLHTVAAALVAAHADGVLHCDVKPANVLLTAFARPVLSDFGIARLCAGSTRGSTTGGYTLDHVAPEVLDGRRPEDGSDVYSLGTTAWTLLAGHPPFRRPDDTSVAAVMHRIASEPAPPLRRRDVPPALAALLTAMTAKRPDVRPGAAEVVHRVEAIALASGAVLAAPLHEAAADLDRVGPALQWPGPSTGAGTDHRPDLAHLTHAGRSAARAAGAPEVAREAAGSRRDRVVLVALVAVVAVLLGLGGLTTWRLVPSAAASTTTLAPAGAPSPGTPPGAAAVPVALASGPAGDGGAGLFGPAGAGLLGPARAAAPAAGGTAPGAPGRAVAGAPKGSVPGGTGSSPVTAPTPVGPVKPLALHVTHLCTRDAAGACSLALGPVSVQLTVTDATGAPFTGTCSDRYQVFGPGTGGGAGGLVSKRTGACNRGPVALDSAVLPPGTYTLQGNANPLDVWFGSITDTFTVAP